MVDDSDRPPHLLAALDGLQRRLTRSIADRMGSAAVTLRGSEGRILQLIAPEGTRPSVLVEGAWITKQAIAKRLQEMQDRGLVTVTPDPADGRAVLVRRTADGDRLLAFALRQIGEVERELADLVGAERYAEFRAVLDELAHD